MPVLKARKAEDATEVRSHASLPGHPDRPAGTPGRGLFATRPVPAGRVVARMSPRSLRIRGAAVDAFCAAHHLPCDAAVFEGSRAWVDPGVDLRDLSRAPWYAMNHARGPRANVRATRRVGAGVVWQTLRPIKSGEELRYDYGDVPTEWN